MFKLVLAACLFTRPFSVSHLEKDKY